MTHTIEVLQEDIDNAVKQYERTNIACEVCIIAQGLNRTFKNEEFAVGYSTAASFKRKLKLSNEVKQVTSMNSNEWKNVKPFTFTATEY